MQSGHISAAELLAPFIRSENGKIGQAIAQSDFSGELKKLIPQPAGDAGASAGDKAAPGNTSAADLKAKDLPAGTPTGTAETKSCPQLTKLKTLMDSKAKIKAIKSKAKEEKHLFVANPAVVEAVLADLKCPAEIRKACKDIENKQGLISIKDLKSLLLKQPAAGSEGSAQVPAKHVRALLESIIAGKVDANRKTPVSATQIEAPAPIKADGTYSRDEFCGLLEKVLQEAEKAKTPPQGLRSQAGTGEAAKTPEGPKAGQAESLLASIIPSFVSTDQKDDSTGKIPAPKSDIPKPAAQSAKGNELRENSLANLKSGNQSSGAPEGEDRQGTASGARAGIKGAGNGSPPASTPASAPPSPPPRQETAGVPAEGLDLSLKFTDSSNSDLSLEQSASGSASAAAGKDAFKAVDSHAALCAQDAVVIAKQINKQLANGDSSQGNAVLQNPASALHANQINLPPMDNSAQNGFAFYDPYQAAELAREMSERLGGASPSRLVLEMDSDGLGKINLKVEARKDEISVVALTQNEPSRQALMNHSVDLRRDLQNQGLVLGKFMVDVNRDKSGGGNYPQGNRTGAKTLPPSKAAKVRSIKTPGTPVRSVKTSGLSQISIFA